MFTRLFVCLALLLPTAAGAADLPLRRHHIRSHHRVRHFVERNNVIVCTTTDLVLVTYSNCGQGLDPLSIAAGK